jgi:hypothetical protein
MSAHKTEKQTQEEARAAMVARARVGLHKIFEAVYEQKKKGLESAYVELLAVLDEVSKEETAADPKGKPVVNATHAKI